jgi:general secretion pathway protein I
MRRLDERPRAGSRRLLNALVGWAKRAQRACPRVSVRTRHIGRLRACITKPSGTRAGGKLKAGFTLVEIIVALAILALCLNVLLTTISDALWRTGEAEAQAEAASLARSLLAQAGSALPLRDGAAAGRFENGFRWRLSATPYGAADQQVPVRAYAVTAEVFWDDAKAERSLALTTLRLGANSAGR